MAQQISSLMSRIISRVWQMSCTPCYDRDIALLLEKLKRLEESRLEIQLNVNEARRNGKLISPEVMTWLEKVDEILHMAETIWESKDSFSDIRARYKLARFAKKMMLDINSLPSQESLNLYVDETWEAELFLMREKISFMNKVEKELRDDDQNSILSLYGGVGNSERVAIHVYKIAKELNIFDEIVMVNVVSTHPNLYKIQCDLAKKLGLEFLEEGTKILSERGKKIHEKLLHSRVLVILYNVKEKFELRDAGFQNENHTSLGRSKVVVISSKVDVCREMGIQRWICIPEVHQQDGWDIFKRMAGDWVQKADRECIAYEFVDQYCGGYSQSKPQLISKLAEEMNEWIKRIEISNGINAPDAHEINKRRMNLFTDAAQPR